MFLEGFFCQMRERIFCKPNTNVGRDLSAGSSNPDDKSGFKFGRLDDPNCTISFNTF
jgi:hypothetical protein